MTKDISIFNGMHVFHFNLSLNWESTLNASWSIKFRRALISILSASVHVYKLCLHTCRDQPLHLP